MEETYVKIACPSCSEHVEFPLVMRGHIIACPHCTLSLVLELPGLQAQSPPPANLYQRLRALNQVNPNPIALSPAEAWNRNSQRPPGPPG